MSWLVSILIGLLMATFGALYAGFMASAAAAWLRISSFEGGSGYFVVMLGLAGLVAGLILGIVVSRYAGGPGFAGFAKALGWSVLVVGGGITLLGGMAWLSAEREPLVSGRPIDLVVEVSVPAGLEAGVRRQSDSPYAILLAGGTSRTGDLQLEKSRKEDGRWIVGARIEIHNTSAQRVAGVALRSAQEQYFDLTLPGKPALSEQWSAWMTEPYFGNRTAPAADAAYRLRYRVEHRFESR